MSFEERIQRQKAVTAQYQSELVQRQTDEQRRKALFEEYKAKFDQAIKATPEYAAAQAILDDPELNEAALAIGKLMQVIHMKLVKVDYHPSHPTDPVSRKWIGNVNIKPGTPEIFGPIEISKSINYDGVYRQGTPGYPKSEEYDFSRIPNDVLRLKGTIKAGLEISRDLKHKTNSIFRETLVTHGRILVKLPFFQVSTDSQIIYRCGNDYLNRSMSELLDVLAQEIPRGSLPYIIGSPPHDYDSW